MFTPNPYVDKTTQLVTFEEAYPGLEPLIPIMRSRFPEIQRYVTSLGKQMRPKGNSSCEGLLDPKGLRKAVRTGTDTWTQ